LRPRPAGLFRATRSRRARSFEAPCSPLAHPLITPFSVPLTSRAGNPPGRRVPRPGCKVRGGNVRLSLGQTECGGIVLAAIYAGPRVSRGGVTRKGVVLTDLQAHIDYILIVNNLLSLFPSPPGPCAQRRCDPTVCLVGLVQNGFYGANLRHITHAWMLALLPHISINARA
jgi:hypothetical protein